MRFPVLALACVLTTAASAQRTEDTAALTLAEAMRLAESAHPTVRSREAQLAAAEGARREATASA